MDFNIFSPGVLSSYEEITVFQSPINLSLNLWKKYFGLIWGISSQYQSFSPMQSSATTILFSAPLPYSSVSTSWGFSWEFIDKTTPFLCCCCCFCWNKFFLQIYINQIFYILLCVGKLNLVWIFSNNVFFSLFWGAFTPLIFHVKLFKSTIKPKV